MAEDGDPKPEEWTLIYHDVEKFKFKGRLEFMRLMLEDKQIPYKVTSEHIYGKTGMMDCFRGSSANVLNEEDVAVKIPNPIFFPPALWHRPSDGSDAVILNQVGACMIYLGEVLGYSPVNPKQKGIANTVLLNAMDYIAEGRRSFHPVEDSKSYSDQKEEGDKVSAEFVKGRMQIWLAHFEKVVKLHGPTSPVCGGETVSYADFALFHVLDATIGQFNNEKYGMAWDKCDFENLKQYHQWMKKRPNLVAYWESGRSPRKLNFKHTYLVCFLNIS